MTVQEIETTRTESLHQSPFAVLGTDTTAAESAEDVMTQANLRGWNVRLRELVTASETVTPNGVTAHPSQLRVPGHFAVIRDNPFTHQEQVISVVGSDYTVKQNEDIETFMQYLLDESGGQITHAADYYENGKQIFMTMELPMSAKIYGDDVINHNLTVFTGHDGNLSLTPVITNMRVMCANMRSAAISSGLSSMRIKHTKNMDSRMALAKTVLGLGLAEAREFDAKADAMAQQKLADAEFWAIVEKIWEPKANPTPVAQTLAAKRRTELTEILHGPTNANIKGTVWAGYNTITEYMQHGAGVSEQTNAMRSLRGSLMQTSAFAQRAALAERLFLAAV